MRVEIDEHSGFCFGVVNAIRKAEQELERGMLYCIGAVLVIRACSYVTAAVRYHRFASLHTILNKATGFCVFCLPYMLVQDFALRYCEITCVIAGLASTEEFLIHLLSKEYEPGRKFIWKR